MTHHIHLSDGVTPEGGHLFDEQADALRPHVLGRHVHDLGSGNGLLSAKLIELGAARVTGIDQAYPRRIASGRVEFLRGYVHEYQPAEPIEVAFVSWPPYLFTRYPDPDVIMGLPRLLAKAPVVAYLGSNFGALCGNPELWHHLGTREVLDHVPNPRNTLIVYGKPGARLPGQGLLPEEKAALYRGAVPKPVYGVTYR